MPVAISILPFFVFLTLLLWVKTSLIKAATVTLALFTILALWYWQILPAPLLGSYVKGFLVALDIFIIIFGAIFFLKILQGLDIIRNVSLYLAHFSGDYRIQVIILAWFLENFIEGTAGFGTPVAIVAPLLIGLGLPVIRALVIALLGNSASVVFGAAGAPIRVGFAGLDISQIPYLSSLINCAGFIVPIFMLWIATTGRKERMREFWGGAAFAAWSGVAFVVPSVIAAKLFGQEFPSIIGSIIGLAIVMVSVKLGIFAPKQTVSLQESTEFKPTMPAARAFGPYALLVLLLIIGKLLLGNASIDLSLVVNHTFALFNPGFAFIAAGLVIALLWKTARSTVPLSLTGAFRGALAPFAVTIMMSTFVQLMANSGLNSSGLPAAITVISEKLETGWLPLLAPFLSAFGSFMTGSATVSNIMFGNFFNTAAISLGLNAALILSLGVVGASAGNMIALSDMLAGEAVVGVKNREREILQGVFIPCFTYLFLVGVIGIIMSYV